MLTDFSGIGFATAVIVFLLNCEYNVILTWALYYIFASFNSVLPWSHCENEWNSPNCTVFDGSSTGVNTSVATNTTISDQDYWTGNLTSEVLLLGQSHNVTQKLSRRVMDPVTEFWELVLFFFSYSCIFVALVL